MAGKAPKAVSDLATSTKPIDVTMRPGALSIIDRLVCVFHRVSCNIACLIGAESGFKKRWRLLQVL